MKKLYVYADFDWLDAHKLIGELSCDSVRGSETTNTFRISVDSSRTDRWRQRINRLWLSYGQYTLSA